MTASENLIYNLTRQQLHVPSPPFVFTEAQVDAFLIDLYGELYYLQEILRLYNLQTELTRTRDTLFFYIIEEKSVFCFALEIDEERRRLKIYFDYRFQVKGELEQIIYYDRPANLTEYGAIDSEFVIERFNHLYFSRNEIARFKLQAASGLKKQ